MAARFSGRGVPSGSRRRIVPSRPAMSRPPPRPGGEFVEPSFQGQRYRPAELEIDTAFSSTRSAAAIQHHACEHRLAVGRTPFGARVAKGTYQPGHRRFHQHGTKDELVVQLIVRPRPGCRIGPWQLPIYRGDALASPSARSSARRKACGERTSSAVQAATTFSGALVIGGCGRDDGGTAGGVSKRSAGAGVAGHMGFRSGNRRRLRRAGTGAQCRFGFAPQRHPRRGLAVLQLVQQLTKQAGIVAVRNEFALQAVDVELHQWACAAHGALRVPRTPIARRGLCRHCRFVGKALNCAQPSQLACCPSVVRDDIPIFCFWKTLRQRPASCCPHPNRYDLARPCSPSLHAPFAARRPPRAVGERKPRLSDSGAPARWQGICRGAT